MASDEKLRATTCGLDAGSRKADVSLCDHMKTERNVEYRSLISRTRSSTTALLRNAGQMFVASINGGTFSSDAVVIDISSLSIFTHFISWNGIIRTLATLFATPARFVSLESVDSAIRRARYATFNSPNEKDLILSIAVFS
jgi:hypothetical protein